MGLDSPYHHVEVWVIFGAVFFSPLLTFILPRFASKALVRGHVVVAYLLAVIPTLPVMFITLAFIKDFLI